jgi:glutathione peroxidase-family protein
VPGSRVGPFPQGNFTEPLIDRDGNVVRRYVSAGAPEKNREYLGSWLAA